MACGAIHGQATRLLLTDSIAGELRKARLRRLHPCGIRFFGWWTRIFAYNWLRSKRELRDVGLQVFVLTFSRRWWYWIGGHALRLG